MQSSTIRMNGGRGQALHVGCARPRRLRCIRPDSEYHLDGRCDATERCPGNSRRGEVVLAQRRNGRPRAKSFSRRARFIPRPAGRVDIQPIPVSRRTPISIQGFVVDLDYRTPPTAVRKEWCSLDERLFSGSCNTSSLANRQALSHYRHRLWSCIQLPYAPPWIHSVRLTRMALARTRVRVKSEERAGGLLTLSGHGAVG